jgi:hypothetical protein
MGLNAGREGGSTILVVKHQAICMESKEPREGFEPVEGGVFNPTTGKQQDKYVRKFGSVDGMVRRLEWYNTEEQYDNQFIGVKVHIEDDGEQFILDLPYNTRQYSVFTRSMEAVDWTKPVEFCAWPDRASAGTGFMLKQEGQKISQWYTKDNPGAAPPPVQDKITKKWDFSAQQTWLTEKLQNEIIPKVDKINAGRVDETIPEYSDEAPKIEHAPAKTKKRPTAEASSSVEGDLAAGRENWRDAKAAF